MSPMSHCGGRERAASSRARRRAALLGASLLILAACGGPEPPPGPGTVMGYAPDLRGQRVMILPVQNNLGVRGDPDAELTFALHERDVSVEWVFPEELEEVLARSPGYGASMHGLPVGNFLAAEVLRIGDPLYGEIRRLSALVDAQIALLPVQVALATDPPPDTTAGPEVPLQPTVRVWTALIRVRTGQVIWFSVLDGGVYPSGDPRGLASAMEEMTRALLWYSDT
ncbi:MAG: hypothetical protein PVI31_10740 [Gemmatimonadota bacterium]